MYEEDEVGVQKSSIIISGLNAVDLIKFVDRKTKKHLATLLSDLEFIIYDTEIDDDEKFSRTRKLVLDSMNNLVRSIVRSIFGEVY